MRVNGATWWLIESSWQRVILATEERQFAALFNLDRLRELQACGIFSDPGVKDLRVES